VHFEEIIGALRAEGEERVAAVHSELEGARHAAGAEAAKRTELEARLRELEVSGWPTHCECPQSTRALHAQCCSPT
jgi:hypothetical protein